MPDIHLDDTIAAIATPLGEGGISVIRLSGAECFKVLDGIFMPKSGKLESFPSHTIHLGTFKEKSGREVDQVLVSIFRNPHSYTGQDVLEISSHGGLVVTKQILDLLITAGARHAEPGEFTKRAFLNGKIDLTQAEAVLDLIRAKSEKSVETAVRQLTGELSRKFKTLKEELMKMYAHMEAFLDFPEEHLEVYEDKVFSAKFDAVEKEVKALIAGFKRGSLLREGALVVLAGKPNVGKSSLFNTLLARDRALVSEFPGTTRDALEEAIEIGGFYIRLVDTAGLSQQGLEHPVDLLGMEKTRESLKHADCFLYVIDGSAPLDAADVAAYDSIRKTFEEQEKIKPVLALINKSDLSQRVDLHSVREIMQESKLIEISAKTKQGFEVLEKELAGIFSPVQKDSEQITRLRHKNTLEESLNSLQSARGAFLRQESLEFVVADLKRAIDLMRELVGEIYSEDLLDVIFSEFCIGK